jgi:hypothetical protein
MTAQERYDETQERYDETQEPVGDTREPVGGTADLIRPERTPPSNQEPDAAAMPDDGDAAPLLPDQSEQRFRSSWEAVQVGFVDEPRESVRRADQLVAELMQELARGFAEARSSLEAEWDRGEDVSTEDLRQALQRYRSFFQRLLAA